MAISKEAIEKIKAMLLEEKARIEKELSEFMVEDPREADDRRSEFPDYGDKPDENAQEIEQYVTNVATENVLEKSLRDINAALKSIENGTYGICKYCKEEIDERRLLARPVASSCVACKEKLQNS